MDLLHLRHHKCSILKRYAVQMAVKPALVNIFLLTDLFLTRMKFLYENKILNVFYYLRFFGSIVGSGPPSLQNEFDNIQTVERSAETDTLKQINQATSPQSDPSPVHLHPPAPASTGRSTTKNEKRSANTLYQELSFQDNEESEENEVTGKNLNFLTFLRKSSNHHRSVKINPKLN